MSQDDELAEAVEELLTLLDEKAQAAPRKAQALRRLVLSDTSETPPDASTSASGPASERASASSSIGSSRKPDAFARLSVSR